MSPCNCILSKTMIEWILRDLSEIWHLLNKFYNFCGDCTPKEVGFIIIDFAYHQLVCFRVGNHMYITCSSTIVDIIQFLHIHTMSSIFIGKNTQKELLANQVAIALALGDFPDNKSHSALEVTNLVNSKIKGSNFKKCEVNYKLDESALAKGFEIFKGVGRRGPIESIAGVEELTEAKDRSNNPQIATLAFQNVSWKHFLNEEGCL